MSLCRICRHGMQATRANNRILTFCTMGDFGLQRIASDVEQCSEFDDKSTPSRWEMDRIAWTLKTGPSGQIRGFTPPEKDKP